MSKVVVEFTGEEARLHAALETAARDIAKFDAGIAKAEASSRKLAKEEENLAREAKRVYDETRTPQEQYAERIKKLDALLAKQGETFRGTYSRAVTQAGEELDKAGKKGHEAFGKESIAMAKEFAGALGFGFGIAEGVKLIKEEWEAVIKVQQKALEASIPNANAQAKFRGAAGFDSPEEAAQFDKRIEEASKATGVKDEDLYSDAARTMKNRHGLTKEQALEATIIGAELYPADQEARQPFSDAILGVQQATGWDAKRSAGWMLRSGHQAGMATPDIAPLLNAAPDQDPRQIMALAQAIGTSTGSDPTRAVLGLTQGLSKGVPAYSAEQAEAEKNKIAEELSQAKEATKDAARQDPAYRKQLEQIETEKASMGHQRGRMDPQEAAKRNLRMRDLADAEHDALRDAERRAEAAPEFQGKLADLERRKKELKERSDLGQSLEAQLEYVRQHPEAREAVLSEVKSRNPKAKIAVGQILAGEGAAADLYRKALVDKESSSEDLAALEKDKKVIQSGPLQATAKVNRDLVAGKDRRETSPVMQLPARQAAMRREIEDVLPFLGESPIESKTQDFFASGAYLANPDNDVQFFKEQRKHIARRIDNLEHPAAGLSWKTITGTANARGYVEREPTKDESAKAEYGKETLAKLDQLIAAIEKNTSETKPQSRPTLSAPERDR